MIRNETYERILPLAHNKKVAFKSVQQMVDGSSAGSTSEI